MTESEPWGLAERAAARVAELTGVAGHQAVVVLGSGWSPAVEAFGRAVAGGADTDAAARTAADAAAQGRDATEPPLALKGRASYLGERSVGHIDPGAASSALLLESLADSLHRS